MLQNVRKEDHVEPIYTERIAEIEALGVSDDDFLTVTTRDLCRGWG
jgi:hypothetical protein